MELTRINEIINLISVFFQLVPIYLGIKNWKKHNSIPYLTLFIVFTFVLDLITFYNYKVLKTDVMWFNNLYILNTSITLIPFFGNILAKNKKLLNVFYILLIFLLSKEVFEYLILGKFLNFNTQCWLWLQIYIVILSILILIENIYRSEIRSKLNIAIAYFSLAFFIAFAFPTIINIFQPFLKLHSKLLFTFSLILVNLLGLVFSVLVSFGHLEILKYSKSIGFSN